MTRSLLVVTGMSGAGRSSCLKILEDMGFEAVDNLPLPLLDRLLRAEDELEGDLAVGMDSRTRGFDPKKLAELVADLSRTRPFDSRLVFFDCDDDVLQQRYTETRHRHPMAADRPVTDGIRRERDLMRPAREAADIVIDTSRTSLADLRRILWGHLGRSDEQRLTVALVSFAFRGGVPREADIVFDARFLNNPHYVDELRPLTGLDPAVQAHIRADPDFASFQRNLEALILPLMPRYRSEGKSYLTIAVGCTGGRHRSVFLVDTLARSLRDAGWDAMTLHREIDVTRDMAADGSTPTDEQRPSSGSGSDGGDRSDDATTVAPEPPGKRAGR